MSETSFKQTAAVVGGGIVGICCALYLQREGHRVVLIDPSEPGESTAKWSCGQMAVSEVIPLSKKGILKKIPAWLLDQTGPLALRPSAFPQIVPWFWHFVQSARTRNIEDIAQALASLTHHVYDDYAPLLNNCTESDLIGTRPILEFYDHAADLEEEREYLALRSRLGFSHQTLNGDDIADLEPVFAGKFKHGLRFDDWTAVKDTKGIIVALYDSFLAQGGVRIQAHANQLIESGKRISHVRLSNGQTVAADYVVLAAGVGSRDFFKQLGIRPPLTGIAGYQAVLPDSGVDIRHSIIYFNGGFCFAPMSRGLQIGGTIEFAAPHAAPNFKRAQIILQKACGVLPQLNTQGVAFGVGYRPFLPDTKPIIDISPNFANVGLAFGHGQLGLTLGATTGRLIADLLHARPTALDVSPFKATRF